MTLEKEDTTWGLVLLEHSFLPEEQAGYSTPGWTVALKERRCPPGRLFPLTARLTREAQQKKLVAVYFQPSKRNLIFQSQN